MDTVSAWTVVTPAESGELVVAVDFPVTGRPEAGFTDLAALLGPDLGFWQTVPPAVDPGSGITGDEYVERWAAELLASGRTIRGVFGFCVGSVYAAELAARVAEAQSEAPELILFDPERATIKTLQWQFEKMVGNLNGVLTDDEVAGVRETAAGLADAAGDDVTAFAAELFAAFTVVAERGLVRLGLDTERITEVMGLFSGFIAYLSVADQVDPLPGWAGATAMTSASPMSGLNPHRPPSGEDSGLVAREMRFGTEHGQLLRSGDVAEAVVKLLRH